MDLKGNSLFVDNTPGCDEAADGAAGAETTALEGRFEDVDAERGVGGKRAGGEVGCEEGATANIFVY